MITYVQWAGIRNLRGANSLGLSAVLNTEAATKDDIGSLELLSTEGLVGILEAHNLSLLQTKLDTG